MSRTVLVPLRVPVCDGSVLKIGAHRAPYVRSAGRRQGTSGVEVGEHRGLLDVKEDLHGLLEGLHDAIGVGRRLSWPGYLRRSGRGLGRHGCIQFAMTGSQGDGRGGHEPLAMR